MGTGWSKLSVEEINVYGEQEPGGKQTLGDADYFSSGLAEVSISADQSTQTSEEATTTKASSSSIPMFQTVDEYGIIAVGGEIELSELEGGGELEEHDDDGFDDPVSKPHSLTMLDPTSPPIKAFLKLQEIEQLNKSRRHHPETVSLQSSKPHQVLSPMAGAKTRAFTANLEESKLGHKEEVLQEFLLLPGVCLQSSSQLSLLPLPRFELNLTREKTSTTTQQEQNNDNNNNNNNNPSSSTRFQFSDPFEPSIDPNNNPQLNALPPVIKSSVLPEGTKIGSSMESSFGNFSQQPFTSAQKLLLFDLNHKRKLAATQSLVSLVGDYLGAASTNELKNPPPPHTSSSLERLIPCEEVKLRSELGMGTTAAMMDIYIEKAIRDHISYNKPGHISSSSAAYNNNSSPYQVKYDNGKEEDEEDEEKALNWNELEPCLVDITKHKDNLTIVKRKRNGTTTHKKRKDSKAIVPQLKKVGDLVYNTRVKSRGRRRRRRKKTWSQN